MAHVCRAHAAAEAAHRVLGNAPAQLLFGRRHLDVVVELDGRPVLDKDKKKLAHQLLTDANKIGDVIKHHAAAENAESAENKKRL